jgi:hypothetical protein
VDNRDKPAREQRAGFLVSDRDGETGEHPPDAVSFVYVEEDFQNAYRFLMVVSPKSYAVLAIAGVVLFGLLCLAVTEWEWRLGISVLAALGGVGGYCFARFWYYPRIARNQFANQPLAQLSRTIALTPGGFSMMSERGETALRWSDFIKWGAGERSILLFTSPRIFLIIPTRIADHGFPVREMKGAIARDFAIRD